MKESMSSIEIRAELQINLYLIFFIKEIMQLDSNTFCKLCLEKSYTRKI